MRMMIENHLPKMKLFTRLAESRSNHVSRDFPSVVVCALLKVANKDGVGNATIPGAGVLLVHCTKLSRRSGLLCKNCASDGRNLFFAVVGVAQESRTPRVTTDRSSCNEDSRCGQLAGKVMVQVVALKCPVQDVA